MTTVDELPDAEEGVKKFKTVDDLPDAPAKTVDDLPDAPQQGTGDYIATGEDKPLPGHDPNGVEYPTPWKGEVADQLATQSPLGRVLDAFGQGFSAEWGDAKFGPELRATLEKNGILKNPAADEGPNPAKEFNEMLVRPAVNALDIALRTATGVLKGVGEAAVEAGVPKDVVGMTIENPLFTGNAAMTGGAMFKVPKLKPPVAPEVPRVTGGVGDLPNLEVARDNRVIGPDAPSVSTGTPAEAAATAIEPTNAFSGKPVSFEATISKRTGEVVDSAKLEPGEPFINARIHADSLEEFNKMTPEERINSTEVLNDNGTPVERTMPAVQNTTDLVKRSETLPAASPFDAKPWTERFTDYTRKLETSDDVRDLIRKSAEENNTFPEARAGKISEEHIGQLSDMTGIPRSELNDVHLRNTFNGPAEFRQAAQIMLQTGDDAFAAARDHASKPTFESRQALVQALMRRDLALEYVVGLRAEWGKTGNTMQEFLREVKDGQALGRFIKERKGDKWDTAAIDDLANKLAATNSREAAAQLLSEARKPDFMDKALWWWTNAILSGPITHGKYILANAAYLAHDALIATPLAGANGLAREILTGEKIERVYMGESVAKAYGLVAGVKDALYAAGQAVKNNVPTPLPAQIKGAGVINPLMNVKPVGGVVGEVVGAPSRVIAGIHSFYNFLGYRAELEAQGYRQAIKDGHSPKTLEFWRAQKNHAYFPDDRMMDAAVDAGARANFVQDLGPAGQAIQGAMYKTKIGRFIMPFLKVPGNIVNAMQEGTPLAYLDSRFRADLTGKNGGVARDTAMGKMVAGSAIMGAAAYWTMTEQITGNGPVDTKQRAEWLLTHQPRSMKWGDKWISYDRFGPVGGWLSWSADITDSTQSLVHAVQMNVMTATEAQQRQHELNEAMARVVVGFTHWVEEAGYEGLFKMVETMVDPEKNRTSGAGMTLSSAMPYSSMQSQLASFMDPTMRDTQTFMDGVKNRIPWVRETMPVLRDWSGVPRPNPMHHAIMRTDEVRENPLDLEMQRLDLKPTKVEPMIKGVRLTPEEYDRYQDLAGINTRNQLNGLVSHPGWKDIPDAARSAAILGRIKSAREQAAAVVQAEFPHLINEGVQMKLAPIMGNKHKPGAFQRPE